MYGNERLVEIFIRSRSGQYMKEEEYDLMLAKRARQARQRIRYQVQPR